MKIDQAHFDETVSHEIDDGLGLLQRDVADQRLVPPVGRVHVDEQDLGQDRPAPVEADSVRAQRRESRAVLVALGLSGSMADSVRAERRQWVGPGRAP